MTRGQAVDADRGKGDVRWRELHAFGRRQVSGALARLTDAERRTVREGLMLYARALRADDAAETEASRLAFQSRLSRHGRACPAIHVLFRMHRNVDARDKPGHDENPTYFPYASAHLGLDLRHAAIQRS